MIIDEKSCKIIFKGEMSILDAEEISYILKNKIEELTLWKKIKIDLQELTLIDSAILQIIISIYQTFPKKTFFSSLNPQLKPIFEKHNLKLK